MIKEFKEFISRGNVIDLAVGVIMGSAFGKIVTSLVNDIIMPLVGSIMGGIDFTTLSVTINDSKVTYGNFIQNVVDFLIVAACIFTMLKLLSHFKKTTNDQLDQEEPKKEEKKVVEKKQPKVRPRPTVRRGVTVTKSTPTGTAHIIMNDDENNQPFEVFIEIGKGGSDIKAMAEALGRIASILLRVNSPLSPKERVKEIVDQLGGIGGQSSVGFGKNKVRSLPDAISQALSDNYLAPEDNQELEKIRQKAEAIGKISADICPECGNSSFINIEGCTKCYLCGHSEC